MEAQDSFLDLLNAPPTQTTTTTNDPETFDEFPYFEYSNNFDDSFDADLDDAQLASGLSQDLDPDLNPNWIPKDIGHLMDQATSSLNIDSLSTHQQLLSGNSNQYNEYGDDRDDDGDEAEAEEEGEPFNSLDPRGKRKGRATGASTVSTEGIGFNAFDEMELYGVPASSQSAGKKGKGKRGKNNKEPSEIDLMMGQVTHLYAKKEYPQAFKLLHEIIRSDHKNAPAWKMWAVLHDELGKPAKALQANFIAAHLDVKDAGLWKRLAEVSQNNGNLTDTIYCYSKAINADPTDTNSWFERSILYADQGLLYKAIHGFNSILQVTPHDMKTIKELARIYIQLRESHKAVRLFEGAIDADLKDPILWDENEEEEDYEMGEGGRAGGAGGQGRRPRWRVGYEELLNLLELYIDVGEYDKGVDAVEVVVGRLEMDDSTAVMDSKRVSSYNRIQNFENVPIEIRVKFGVCKLWLEDHEVAKSHFDALLELEVDDYSDLFIEVIDTYMKKRMFALAVGILEHIVKNERMNVASVWAKMADCFQHLGRLEDAVELYIAAIEVEPREYDWQLQLAEIYEALGDSNRAAAIVDEVNERTKADVLGSSRKPRSRKRRASQYNQLPQQPQDGPLDGGSTSVTYEAPAYGSDEEYSDDEGGAGYDQEASGSGAAGGPQGFLKPRPNRIHQDKAVILAAERLAIAENKEWYAKMLSLEAKLNEVVKRADFVRFARKLVIRFQNERQFYPADRAKTYCFRGYRGEEDREVMYQGLTFSQWFEIFVKCAMALTMDKKDEDAYLALKTAYDANVFYHNEPLRLQLRLYMIAAATVCGNYGRVVELARSFCIAKIYDNDSYRFFCAVLNGGPDGVSAFASDICAKHFHRQLNQFHTHLMKHPNSEIHKNPILLSLYGHILFSARSYSSALS
ncbi:UNVERIFIED_CONTAM: transcription factor TFIIIC subunit tfc4 [Siphonaria sp. JEL0065]|nr:transcription factor TFIIIC subunit tfc4 [Siphonaria sp. JEL0065]